MGNLGFEDIGLFGGGYRDYILFGQLSFQQFGVVILVNLLGILGNILIMGYGTSYIDLLGYVTGCKMGIWASQYGSIIYGWVNNMFGSRKIFWVGDTASCLGGKHFWIWVMVSRGNGLNFWVYILNQHGLTFMALCNGPWWMLMLRVFVLGYRSSRY